MVVATTTFHRQTHQRGCDRLSTIGNVLDAKLLRDASAFDLLRMKAVERRRKDFVLPGIGQQIPGQLLRNELVVRHVSVERVDHPVSPRPNKTITVHLVPVRVAVPRRVQPVGRHPFTELFTCQQTVQQLFVGIR